MSGSLTQSSRGVGLVGVVLILLLLALIAGQQILSIAHEGSIYRTLQDALHAPWFFCVTLVVCVLLRSWPTLPRLLVAALVAVALAVVTELAQTQVADRSASLGDFQRNLVGGGLALLFSTLVIPWRPSWLKFLGALVIGLLLTAYTAWPLWQQWQLREDRVALAPQLVDLADPRVVQYVTTNSYTSYSLGRATTLWPAYEGQTVLRLRYGDDEYPTLYVNELNQRWQAYEHLVLELYLLGDTPLPLVAAVQYAGSTGTSSYFNMQAEPGVNRLLVPRERLVPAAAHAVQVRDFLLHTTAEYAGRTLLLGALYLE